MIVVGEEETRERLEFGALVEAYETPSKAASNRLRSTSTMSKCRASLKGRS